MAWSVWAAWAVAPCLLVKLSFCAGWWREKGALPRVEKQVEGEGILEV